MSNNTYRAQGTIGYKSHSFYSFVYYLVSMLFSGHGFSVCYVPNTDMGKKKIFQNSIFHWYIERHILASTDIYCALIIRGRRSQGYCHERGTNSLRCRCCNLMVVDWSEMAFQNKDWKKDNKGNRMGRRKGSKSMIESSYLWVWILLGFH